MINKDVQMIRDYVIEFDRINGRAPIREEIDTNMKDKVSIESMQRFNSIEEQV